MDGPYFIGPFRLWPGVQKEEIFCTVYFVRGNFFNIRVLPQCIVYFNTLTEYKYFYISKNISSYTFVACF